MNPNETPSEDVDPLKRLSDDDLAKISEVTEADAKRLMDDYVATVNAEGR